MRAEFLNIIIQEFCAQHGGVLSIFWVYLSLDKPARLEKPAPNPFHSGMVSFSCSLNKTMTVRD